MLKGKGVETVIGFAVSVPAALAEAWSKGFWRWVTKGVWSTATAFRDPNGVWAALPPRNAAIKAEQEQRENDRWSGPMGLQELGLEFFDYWVNKENDFVVVH